MAFATWCHSLSEHPNSRGREGAFRGLDALEPVANPGCGELLGCYPRQGCLWVPGPLGQLLWGTGWHEKWDYTAFLLSNALFGGLEPGTEARGQYVASARFAAVLPRNTCRTTFPIRLHCLGTWGVPQPGLLGRGGGSSWRCLRHCHAPVGSRVLGQDARGDLGIHRPRCLCGWLVACTAVLPPRCLAAGFVTPGSSPFASGQVRGVAAGECGPCSVGMENHVGLGGETEPLQHPANHPCSCQSLRSFQPSFL